MLAKIALSAAGFGLEELYRLRTKDRVSKQSLVMQIYIQLAHVDLPAHEALQVARHYAEVFIKELQELSEEDFKESSKNLLVQADEIE